MSEAPAELWIRRSDGGYYRTMLEPPEPSAVRYVRADLYDKRMAENVTGAPCLEPLGTDHSMKREATGFNIHGETMAEYYQRRTNERGADMEHMLLVMRTALDSLDDDNDAASAAAVLRTCLRQYGR